MEILRLPETTSIQLSIDVPSASATYRLDYEDIVTGESYSASATSNASAVVTFTLNSYYLTYNGSLVGNVYNNSNSLVYSTGIDVVRPYCDVTSVAEKLGVTNAVAIQSEKIARKTIESEAGNFGLIRKKKEIVGMGLDYLPVNEKIQSLYYVWENGELIHDYSNPDLDTLKISVDGTSIIPNTSPVNKMNYKFVWRDRFLDTDFTDGYEYVIEADFGYRYVPEDIIEACELLIQDVSSDNMKYANRYIEQFDNKEFNIKFAKGYANNGTGNALADKLLAGYKNRIVPGVI